MFIFFFLCAEAADRLLAIQIITDKAFKTLTIQDNGIGMSKVRIVGSFCSVPSSSPGGVSGANEKRVWKIKVI
jgi:HSP90 family molecular chaperone